MEVSCMAAGAQEDKDPYLLLPCDFFGVIFLACSQGSFAHDYLSRLQSWHVVGCWGNGPEPLGEITDWCWYDPSFCPFKPLETTVKGWSDPDPQSLLSGIPITLTVAPILEGGYSGEISVTDSIHFDLLLSPLLRIPSMMATTLKRSTPVLPCLGFPGCGESIKSDELFSVFQGNSLFFKAYFSSNKTVYVG